MEHLHKVRAEEHGDAHRSRPVKGVAVAADLKGVGLMTLRLPQLPFLVVVRRFADELTEGSECRAENQQAGSSKGLGRLVHYVGCGHIARALRQLHGVVRRLQNVEGAVLDRTDKDVRGRLAEGENALHCRSGHLTNTRCGVLDAEVQDEVGEGIAVSVGSFRRLPDGDLSALVPQFLCRALPRGVVCRHEPRQGVGVGKGAEHRVALVHEEVRPLAVALQKCGLEDTAFVVDRLGQRPAVVVFPAREDNIPYILEVRKSSLEGWHIGDGRSRSVDVHPHTLQHGFRETGDGLLQHSCGLHEGVACQISHLRTEVAQHRQIAPSGELIHRRGLNLIGDILGDLLHDGVPLVVVLGLVVRLDEFGVDFDVGIFAGVEAVFTEFVVDLIHLSAHHVQLAGGRETLEDLRGLQCLTCVLEQSRIGVQNVEVCFTGGRRITGIIEERGTHGDKITGYLTL